MSNNKVSIGSTTIVGWVSAILALVPTIVKAVETGSTALNGPEKYLAVTGIVIGAITQIGRYLQAHKLIGINTEKIFSDLSNDFESPVTPETAVKPDGPKTTEASSQPVSISPNGGA
jgi:hypothetical protein